MSKYTCNRLIYFIDKFGYKKGLKLRHKERNIQSKLKKYINKL